MSLSGFPFCSEGPASVLEEEPREEEGGPGPGSRYAGPL